MGDKVKAEKKRGIGDAAADAIKSGLTNEEALEAVKKEFPDANTSVASVGWYRNQIRQTDKSVPTARELKKKKDPKDPLE